MIDAIEIAKRSAELDAEEQALNEKLKNVAVMRAALEQEQKNNVIAVNKEVLDFIRKNREFILSHMKHSCSSCKENGEVVNGYNSDVGYARCTKCFLIEMLDVDYYSEIFKIDFDFNITSISE